MGTRERLQEIPKEITTPSLRVDGVMPSLPEQFVIPERQVSDELKAVALHEMGHALIAYAEGVAVDYVSVIPNPTKGYRGVTKLKYLPDDAYKLQKIAAGGSLFSEDGNGSDMYTIDFLHREGGKSRDEVFATAMDYKKMLSGEEWAKVAEIVASRQTIQGAEIGSVISQARFEIALEAGRGEKPKQESEKDILHSWIQISHSKAERKIAEAEPGTVIEAEMIESVMPNGIKISYRVANGVLVDDSLRVTCTLCGGVEIHAKGCPSERINLRKEIDRIRALPLHATVVDSR